MTELKLDGFCNCGCGQQTEIAPHNHPRYGWIKGKPRPYIAWHSKYNTPEKFWNRVAIDTDEECWNWLGGTNSDGYGSVYVRGEHLKVHRYAYELTCGEIPDGMHVCHKCDNRKCCNPGHMFIGTNQDNIDDKVSKRRQARGVRISLAKLTPDKVTTIRNLYLTGNYTHRELGRMFGVDGSNITRALNGQQWKHVK